MDRRVLIGVGLLAVVFAVGLGVLLAPDTEVPATPVVERPVEQARTEHVPMPVGKPRPMPVRPATASAEGVPGRPTAPVTPQVASTRLPPPDRALMNEQQREYRCRALGQQADLIDRLVVVGQGGAVDEGQRAQMVSRVAQMSMQVYDEGEHLWSGALSCDGISDVNLGQAADFLARMRDELDLDEKTETEVEQALGVLDQVEWPEAEAEEE